MTYKDCEKIYFGGMEFRMKKKNWTAQKGCWVWNNTIARHVEEYNHQIDWDNTVCLEKEKKFISKEDFRKHIYKGKQTIVHELKRWNRGEYSVWEGEGGLAEEGKTR